MGILDHIEVLRDTGFILPQLCKGDGEVNNVDALEAPNCENELGEELDGGDEGKERNRVLQREDPPLINKTNGVVIRPALDGAPAGLVPRPVRPISFLGAEIVSSTAMLSS